MSFHRIIARNQWRRQTKKESVFVPFEIYCAEILKSRTLTERQKRRATAKMNAREKERLTPAKPHYEIAAVRKPYNGNSGRSRAAYVAERA